MINRKQKIMRETNSLSEQRYLYNKFLKEDEEQKEIPKLQVSPIAIEGSVNKYKINLFQKQPNGNLKNIMTDDILIKLKLKNEYASQESAAIDISKIIPSQLEDI
jgi:hypothetical protein